MVGAIKEYRKQLQELKEKAAGLEALNTKISRDRQETVAVNKQVAASSEAAVVLIYCQYILSNEMSYDSHGTGFLVSADGKVATDSPTSLRVVGRTNFRAPGPDVPATIRIAPKTHLHFVEQAGRPLAGSSARIVEDLLAYQAQGVSEFIFYCPGPSEPQKLENLHRIAEEIAPHVA